MTDYGRMLQSTSHASMTAIAAKQTAEFIAGATEKGEL